MSSITFDCSNLSGILFVYQKNNINNVSLGRVMPHTVATLVTGTGRYDLAELDAGLVADSYDISGTSLEYSIDDGSTWTLINKSTGSKKLTIGDSASTIVGESSDTYIANSKLYPKLTQYLMSGSGFTVRDRTIYFRDSSNFETNKEHILYSDTAPAGSSHIITCTLPEHTTASITFPYNIEDGKSTSFTVSPASGYNITDLSATVNGVALGVSQLTTGSWTITTGEVTADEEIVITATVSALPTTTHITVTNIGGNSAKVDPDAGTYDVSNSEDYYLSVTFATTADFDEHKTDVGWSPTVKLADGSEYDYDSSPFANEDGDYIGFVYIIPSSVLKANESISVEWDLPSTSVSYSVTISDGTSYSDLVLSHTPENISSLSGSQTITVTIGSNSATESYRFTDAPVAEKTSGGLITGVLSTNKQTATYSIPEDNTENITITVDNDNIETFSPTPTTEDYPYFTYAYLPTAGQIKTISDAQWLDGQGGVVDLITYANRYEQLFDTLTSDKTREMYLGAIDVGIKVAYLEDRVFTRDLGTVAIEEHFHDADDYKSTTIRLYVPLYGYIDLDPSDCMGHNIGLSYKYEVDSGRALAMVYCDFLTPQTILWQGAVNFAIEMPIGSLGASDYTSSYWTILTQQLGELRPYVVITRKTPATDILDVRGRRGQKVVKVSDVTGFVKYDTIFLTGIKASLTELNEIASYLKTGVLVN